MFGCDERACAALQRDWRMVQALREPPAPMSTPPAVTPPLLARSLSARLENDDAVEALFLQCGVPTLRVLGAASRAWGRRVGTALRASVRDHSLALGDLSWAELDWLLRRLRREGARVEKLRCEQASISFAPLLAAPRVSLDDLRGCCCVDWSARRPCAW